MIFLLACWCYLWLGYSRLHWVNTSCKKKKKCLHFRLQTNKKGADTFAAVCLWVSELLWFYLLCLYPSVLWCSISPVSIWLNLSAVTSSIIISDSVPLTAIHTHSITLPPAYLMMIMVVRRCCMKTYYLIVDFGTDMPLLQRFLDLVTCKGVCFLHQGTVRLHQL